MYEIYFFNFVSCETLMMRDFILSQMFWIVSFIVVTVIKWYVGLYIDITFDCNHKNTILKQPHWLFW